MNETSRDGAAASVPMFDQQLTRQTRRSIFWTMGQAAGDQLFSFAVFVLLARLLDKTAIGTFAIAFVFMDLGRSLATSGVAQRVARAKQLSQRELDTIFWTNLSIAVAFSLLMVAAARPAERVFDAPQLAPVLMWLTVPIILSGAANTHMALRLREFGHRTLALRSVLAGLLGGSCAVIAALWGAGIWALVLQRVVREIVSTILAWTAYNWRPGARFDFAEALAYGKQTIELGVAQTVTLLSLRAQDLGVARVLGPVALSNYRVAWRCAELIGPQIVGPFATVALQTFSRVREHAAELKTAYVSLLQQCAFISVPAIVGYAIAGPWLVPALFGPQWHDAGTIAPMLLPLALPFTISGFVLALLAAYGRVTWQRHLAVLDLTTTIAVVVLTVGYGLKWLALAYSVRGLLIIPVQLHFVRAASGVTIKDHVDALALPVSAAAVMGIFAVALFRFIDPQTLLATLLLCGAAALFYGSIIAAVMPSYRRAAMQFLKASGNARSTRK